MSFAHPFQVLLYKVARHGLCLLLASAAQAQTSALPPSVEDAMQRAKLPRDALSVVVLPVGLSGPPRLQHQPEVARNPASLMKLVTTSAALDLLGPAFTWRTPVFLDGAVRDGVLSGHVYLQGSGDPKLGVEQLWLLMRRLQGLGIRKVQGDIVLDRSAFVLPPHDPASFDGEPLRPYNAAPDAFLVGFKSLLIQFVPDPVNKVARVHVEPPLAGVQVQATVPLMGGDCSDYRAALKPEFGNPLHIRFMGGFPSSCPDKLWPLAHADPEKFAARAVHGMWLQLGGQLSGQVREGLVPSGMKPVFTVESPTLGEVVRDINKFSNNLMAEQVFLTLALQKRGTGTPVAAKEVVEAWWCDHVGGEPPFIDKGSGLSRESRISAQALANLLAWDWRQGFMPELIASLPLTGLDGTMKRSKSSASAHLKTGSLRDSMGIAGYVDGQNGQRFVLVAMVNHANAHQARPVMDALIDWTAGK